MESTKISIIVPIYNAEKKIERTIESIQNQTLNSIQIILINDGSTDNSLKICEEYAKKDRRITVIDKKNEGVSSARNAGIKEANGEYIGFVDADDWVSRDMYKQMINKIEKNNSDLGMCNYTIHKSGKRIVKKNKLDLSVLKEDDIAKKIVANMIYDENLDSNLNVIMGSVWRFVIKKSVIQINDISFEEDLNFMEDLVFLVEVLLQSKKVVLIDECYYNYIISKNSLSNSYHNNLFEIQVKVYNILEKILKENNYYESLKNRMEFKYISFKLNLILNIIKKNNSYQFNSKINEIKSILNDKYFQNIIRRIDFQNYGLPPKRLNKFL